MVRMRCVLMLTGILLGLAPASRAFAQSADAPGPYAVDVRVAMPSFAPTDGQAQPLGLEKVQLPRRGLGLELGASVYPIRKGGFALGVGVAYTNASGTAKATTAAQAGDETAMANAPEIKTRFNALSPQVSLNFGSRRGWSYIGGGIGWARRGIEQTAGTPTVPDAEDTERARTLHYGGGARWFWTNHVAFGFDMRWHRLPAQEATATARAFPKQSFFVIAGGITLR